MNKIIGLKELRQNVDTYIQEVQKGKTFIVIKRSVPVFKISPLVDDDDDEKWETVIDFTKIKKGGVPAKELLKYL